MSTILKALRRLEEEQPTPADGARPGALPATDPRAADALRERLLAEEEASRVGASAERSAASRRTLWMAVAGIGVGLVALAAFLWMPLGDATRSLRSAPADDAASLADASGAADAGRAGASPADRASAAPGERAPRQLQFAVLNPSPANAGETAEPGGALDDATAGAAAGSPSGDAARTGNTGSASAAPRADGAQNQTSVASAGSSPVGPRGARATATAPDPKPTPEAAPAAPERAAPVESAVAVRDEASAGPDPAAAAAAQEARPRDPVGATTSAEAAPRAAAADTPRAEDEEALEVAAVEPTAAARAADPRRAREIRPGDTRPAGDGGSASAPSSAQPLVRRDAPVAPRATIPDVAVLRTSWHPDASRRSARIRIEANGEVVTLREGDAVGALVVREISPSAVLFQTGEVEIRRRVGEGAGRD